MRLLWCVLYIAGIGIVSNPIGGALPRRWFHPERAPFRAWGWEKEGQIYEKLGIRIWKDKLPDMSKILPGMYRKQVNPQISAANLERLLAETCVAEAVHSVLLVLSLAVVPMAGAAWGWLVYLACIIGNLPFILIQRFNRPRLQRALERCREREARKKNRP